MATPPNGSKEPIHLFKGDPSKTGGHLKPHQVVIDAVREVLEAHTHNGYEPAVGSRAAREAIATHFNTQLRQPAPSSALITADDVFLANGCAHTLELAFLAVAETAATSDHHILVPEVGFHQYKTLTHANGIATRDYRLRMEEGGLVDLEHLESQIVPGHTRAIVVNNPSNPMGVVYPKEHLEAILRVAHRHRLIVIADEIYGDIAYGEGVEFHPMASLSPAVPVITCDGIGKRWLVPGWRLGWLIVHDRYGVLSNVKAGIASLADKIAGPCALVQGALPKILRDTPSAFFDHIRSTIATNAELAYERLSRVPGLRPLKPQGAMYMVVEIADRSVYGGESEFVEGLIREESVYCLPGSVFGLRNWVRLVLTFPEEMMQDACERIASYCDRKQQDAVETSEPVSEIPAMRSRVAVSVS
jgi:tyrosine aminotransferase